MEETELHRLIGKLELLIEDYSLDAVAEALADIEQTAQTQSAVTFHDLS